MQIHTFIAESATDAISQIRSQLGSSAVVLNVRRQPVDGISRLWQKPRIEVLAYVPEPTPPLAASAPQTPTPSRVDPVHELRDKLAQIEQKIASSRDIPALPGERPSYGAPVPGVRALDPGPGEWRVGLFLENSGIAPIHAQRVVEQLRLRHGDTPPPEGFGRELELASQVLTEFWEAKVHRSIPSCNTHVLVGPAGAGKTTCICKWLAEEVLLKNRRAAVWRLDGRIANTAEILSVYCDILGVPVQRLAHDGESAGPVDIRFIDLPGINWNSPDELKELHARLKTLPDAQVHLVLNGAYESSLLLAQARAFDGLAIRDVIVTHLDEETRWGKLWNLVLGTNYSLRFLSAGQNIPGDLTPATSQKLLRRQFTSK